MRLKWLLTIMFCLSFAANGAAQGKQNDAMRAIKEYFSNYTPERFRLKNCGLERKRETIKVKIPAGVEAGMQLTLHGEGHAAKNNGVNGDLLVVIEEQEHPNLKREGNNLFYTKIISVPEAILGGEVEIPGIDGTYKIKVEPGTQSGSVVKLKGRGLPTVNGYCGTGDLYVKFAVWIPKKLSKEDKAIIESLKNKDSFKPNPTKEDKSFFDRLKDLF